MRRDSFRLVEMVKQFTRTCKYFLLALLFAVLCAALWLQGGARDLSWAKGWLLSAMNPADAPYEIGFSDVMIRWDNFTEFGDLRVSNLQVSRKGGAVFAAMPEVKVTIDPLGFLPRRRALHGIEIEKAKLYLTRNAEGVLEFGLEGVEGAMPVEEFTGFFASDSSDTEKTRQRLPFRELALEHASFVYTDAVTGVSFAAPDFNVRLGRTGRSMNGSLAMPFTYGNRKGSIDAALYTVPLNYERVLNIRVQDIPLEMTCLLLSCPADTAFTGSVSGKVSLKQQPGEPIDEAELTLAATDATVDAPTLFPDRLDIKRAGMLLRADEGLRRVMLEGATAELRDTNLSLTAQALKQDDGWYAQGQANCSKLDIRKLYKYWPLSLSPDSRAWVTTQLKSGHAESGTVNFAVTPEDINGATLRDEAIDAVVIARGLEVAYLQGFPNVTDANGVVKFSGKRIHIDLESGKLLSGTVVKPSTMDFTDLDNPDTPVETTLNLSAPAKDVAAILQQPLFTFDDGVKLDPATISGSADATLKLAFDAFAEPAEGADPNAVNLSAVSYDIAAELKDIAQPKLMDGRDVKGLSGTLKANDASTEFTGTVKLDGGTNVALNLSDKDGKTTVGAKGRLARSQFSSFGLPEIKQLGEGSVALDVAVEIAKDATVLSRADIDLTGIAMDVDELSWSKKAGEKASLSVVPATTPRSYGLKLTAPGLSLGNASLTLNEAMDDVASLSLPQVKTDKNDFALEYARQPQGYKVALRGASLDISQAYSGEEPVTDPKEAVEEKPLENSLLGDFPAIDLTLDLQRFTLVEGQPLTGVKGVLRCDVARCSVADISANAGAANISATIGPVDGIRQFVLTSSDAGDFLRALDVSDRMFGGTLELKGTYDDTATPAPFSGRLFINKFKLRNSEILARIISIGSLSGLANVLTGEGIEFKKISANIDALGGVIQVAKGRAESNALGLTLEGEVDTNRSNANLKGVVVPANSLNSLFGKIPVIGALAGGEGEGLIAFNYSVKGALDNPDVMVNPLSGLTPGFLRGIFTLGDEKPKPLGSEPEAKTQPSAEQPKESVPWPSERDRKKRP